MRGVNVVGVLLAARAATLSAQHAHQLEIGGFGSYTRYDKLFLLDNQVGGGGRLGFFFNESLGLEVDANIAYPFPKAGGPHTDRKSTRLNSSHGYISYAVFCLKKKNKTEEHEDTMR